LIEDHKSYINKYKTFLFHFRLCKVVIRCVGGTTRGLMSHLETQHLIKIDRVVGPNAADPVHISRVLRNDLNDKAVDMIIEDGLPFMTFQKKGIRKFLSGGIPAGYKGPCRSLVNKKIRKLVEIKKRQIKALFKNVDDIHITTDMWSSRKATSFIEMGAHWIDDDFNLNHRIILMERFTGRHTGENIARVIKNTTDYYGISDKIVSATTDSGSNVKKSTEILNLKRRPCLGHNLHLVVCHGTGIWERQKSDTSGDENDEENEDTGQHVNVTAITVDDKDDRDPQSSSDLEDSDDDDDDDNEEMEDLVEGEIDDSWSIGML